MSLRELDIFIPNTSTLPEVTEESILAIQNDSFKGGFTAKPARILDSILDNAALPIIATTAAVFGLSVLFYYPIAFAMIAGFMGVGLLGYKLLQ